MSSGKATDTALFLEWVKNSLEVNREDIKKYASPLGIQDIGWLIESAKRKYPIISITRRAKGERGRTTTYTYNEKLALEAKTWIECTMGPTDQMNILSMEDTLSRHGYQEKSSEEYEGWPRTYTISEDNGLGSTVNWTEPYVPNHKDKLSQGESEKEFSRHQNCLQQKAKEKRGSALPIEKLYAGVEAQLASDIRTMGKEKAYWWKT